MVCPLSGRNLIASLTQVIQKNRQFWSAGEYVLDGKRQDRTVGLDHSRVSPKFLHSNATSHKWALGGIAELIDNSMDEVDKGATFVRLDVEHHVATDMTMLTILDDGGGMDPERLHKMMSFGMCTKQGAKKIGQYGNGFKTSSMRLGADAIVFTKPKDGVTQSVGFLSFTFLREEGHEDVVIPLLGMHASPSSSPSRSPSRCEGVLSDSRTPLHSTVGVIGCKDS